MKRPKNPRAKGVGAWDKELRRVVRCAESLLACYDIYHLISTGWSVGRQLSTITDRDDRLLELRKAVADFYCAKRPSRPAPKRGGSKRRGGWDRAILAEGF